MILTPEDIEAVAQRTAEIIRATPTVTTEDVLTHMEARFYVKRPSRSAFGRWCKANHIKPYHRGRYSRTQLDLALSREARKRAA